MFIKKMTKEDKTRQYIDGRCTQDEVLQALRQLADPDEPETFDRLSDEVMRQAEDLAPWADEAERLQLMAEARTLLRRIAPPVKKSVSFNRKRLSVAAGIVAVMGLSLLGILLAARASSATDIIYSQVSTSYGEVKEVVLPDGTQVSLNACSSLSYPETFSGQSTRAVELKGQGFFRVARNERQPFVVKTTEFDVRVLGTEFDVKSYAGDEVVSVNVKSGKVQVNMPDASMLLRADEQLHYNTRSNGLDKHTVEQEAGTWQHGELQFDNTPIQDVVRELERQFNCVITYAPGQRFDNMITGSHTNDNLESILESLKYISGINYTREENGYRLSVNN